MLDLSAAAKELAGISLSRDEQDPHRFHALPPPPRVARDRDAPQVDLLRFVRDGELSGGHLQLLTEIAYPPGALEQAAQALRESEKDDRITVSPVPVLAATAELFFAGQETTGDGGLGALVRRLYGKTVPLLDPPHRARFSALLTPDGVRVIEAALRSGGAPVGVVYRLQVEGVRPAQRVLARVDFSQVYEQLSAHSRQGQLLVTEDLFKLSERLVQDRVITLDVVHALVGEDGAPAADTTAEALAWIQREIIERFCEPVLALDREPARVSLGALGELLGVGSAFAVRDHVQVERGTVVVDLQRAAVVVRTLTLQAHLRDLLGGSPLDGHIADAGPGHPFFERVALHLRAARPLAAAPVPVKEVVGEWAYGATRAALRLTPEQPEADASAWGDASADRSWTLDLSATLADDAPLDAGQRVPLPQQVGHSGELTLDLERLLALRRVELSMAPDPERLLATQVKLRHLRGAETHAEQQIALTPQAPQLVAWFRDFREGDRIEATPRHLLKNGQRVEGAALPVDTTVFRLPPPFPGVMTVQLFAEDDWSGLDRVVVSLQKRADLPAGTFPFAAGGTSLAVNLDLPDPADRGFRYRMARTWSDGRVEEDEWAETDVPAVLVGKVAGNLLVVDVTPIGPELPAAGIVLVEVELSYIDAPNQVRDQKTALIHARADRYRWEVKIADPRARSYEYRVTVHRTSGAKQEGPWTRSDQRILPVPITPA